MHRGEVSAGFRKFNALAGRAVQRAQQGRPASGRSREQCSGLPCGLGHSWSLRFLSCSWSQGPAQEWTRFRGPNGSGISPAKTIPTIWTEKDINWKAALPGPGHSSPVLWGEKVFVTAGDEKGEQFHVLVPQRRRWAAALAKGLSRPIAYPKHNYNTFRLQLAGNGRAPGLCLLEYAGKHAL